MFKLKFVLPMLAFVLAIGMSFAFEENVPGDFIEINGQLYESPVNCQGQGTNCTALISKDGVVQEVQVMRETSPGVYEEATTTSTDNTVYLFSSLTPVTP